MHSFPSLLPVRIKGKKTVRGIGIIIYYMKKRNGGCSFLASRHTEKKRSCFYFFISASSHNPRNGTGDFDIESLV